MPVPDLAHTREDWPFRLAIQSAVFASYLLVAIALLYSAWRISATSEMIDRVLGQQSQILSNQDKALHEIRDARATIPAEVKSAIPDVLRSRVK